MKSRISNKLLGFLILIVSVTLGACDQTATPPDAQISGATFLQFRCMNLEEDNAQVAPLEQCGCLESDLSPEGRVLSQKGRDTCLNENRFQVVGYLGSTSLNRIAIMKLDGSPRAILDQSTSIPGINHFNSDGLINELMVHPYGDFMFTIDYNTGELALSLDHRSLRPDLIYDLGLGAISSTALWPTLHQSLPKEGSDSLLYIASAIEPIVYELNLDLLSLEIDRILEGEEVDLSHLVLRSWSIHDLDDDPKLPQLISVNERGDRLAVSHLEGFEIQVIDLSLDSDDLSNTQIIKQEKTTYCDDLYLTDILAAYQAFETCKDGLDNDQNGLTDMEDPNCQRYQVEAINLSCPQLGHCADQIDNDGDGLIDQADPECTQLLNGERIYREGRAPACDDGEDNDGDGLIDRADPGCQNQDDDDESYTSEISSCFDEIDNDNDGVIDMADSDCTHQEDAEQIGDFNGEGEDLCQDQLDNDSDGLIDIEDPGCHDPLAKQTFGFERSFECSDQIDNDGDGLIDFGEDPQCTCASDNREQEESLSHSSSILKLVSLNLPSGQHDVLISHNRDGRLVLTDFSQQGKISSKTYEDIIFPKAIEVRTTGALSTVFIIDQNNHLSNIHLTTPQALKTANNEAIYARGAMQSRIDTTENGSGEVNLINYIDVTAFYLIREGNAYQVKDLDEFIGELNYDPATQVPMIDLLAQEKISDIVLTENNLEILELPPKEGGLGDPQVFLQGNYRFNRDRWNRNRTALGQSNRVNEVPTFSVDGINITLNKSKHASFCSLARDEGMSTNSETCTLVGSTPEGRTELSSEEGLRRASQIEFYEGIVVTESDPQKMIGGGVTVSYEGEIPQSRSRTGLYIKNNTEENSWVFADYQADFCNLGVEEGDLFVAERFYPLSETAAKDAVCSSYLNRSPSEGEDPLRYRIASVSQHALILVQDDRESYAPQLDLLGSSRLPKLAPSLPPPPYRCAAQAIAYSIRAGQNQWLVNTDALGYVHPWVNRNGRCIQAPKLIAQKRFGRAILGETFENTWFKFRLGYQESRPGVSGIPQGSLPTMVGARFTFNLNRGALNQLLLGAGLLPTVLRWLPEKDRLYIVDSALKSVTEYEGIDPYLGNLRIVQTYQ